MDYSIRLLSAVSCTEEVHGKNRNMVYLFGTTKDGEAIAVRTPLLMPYFQVVEPPKDIIDSLEKRDDVENLEHIVSPVIKNNTIFYVDDSFNVFSKNLENGKNYWN